MKVEKLVEKMQLLLEMKMKLLQMSNNKMSSMKK